MASFEPVVAVKSTSDEEAPQNEFKRELPEALRELMILSSLHLNQQQQQQVLQLIVNYKHVFATSEDDFGKTNLTYDRINTGSAKPIKQAPRRVSWTKQEKINNLLHDMQVQGVIKLSKSPWTSPVVLVREKDGTTRFCVDYRKLNGITEKDSYPLTRIDNTMDSLVGAKYVSTLHLKSGYWYVEVHPEDRERTAFSSGQRL